MGGKVRSSSGGQKPTRVVDVVAVAASDHWGSDTMAKVEEMTEKLEAENLSLHGELVAKCMAHDRALMNNIRLEWNRKKAVEKMEGVAQLLGEKRAKQKNSAVVKKLKKNDSAATMRVVKNLASQQHR